MTDHDSRDPTATEGETPDLDHDARPGGPNVNAPGDEPDPDSPTEQKQGDAGRLDAKDL